MIYSNNDDIYNLVMGGRDNSATGARRQ